MAYSRREHALEEGYFLHVAHTDLSGAGNALGRTNTWPWVSQGNERQRIVWRSGESDQKGLLAEQDRDWVRHVMPLPTIKKEHNGISRDGFEKKDWQKRKWQNRRFRWFKRRSVGLHPEFQRRQCTRGILGNQGTLHIDAARRGDGRG